MTPGLRGRARERRALRALPPAVRDFYRAARAHAQAVGDTWGEQAATRPDDLAALLALARGATTVVELGTASGWTSVALALDDPDRRITSYDPVVQPHRGDYLALVPASVTGRIDLIQAPGADGPAAGGPDGVGFLFIDSTHDRDATIAEFTAWRPRLTENAVVAFHDHGHPDFPGVADAVAALGLGGRVEGGTFVWRVDDRF